MEDDEAMQRFQAPQQNHRHCRLVEAETQRAPPPRLSTVLPTTNGPVQICIVGKLIDNGINERISIIYRLRH